MADRKHIVSMYKKYKLNEIRVKYVYFFIHTLFDNACCNIENTAKWNVPSASDILPLLCGSHCKTNLNHCTILFRRQLK